MFKPPTLQEIHAVQTVLYEHRRWFEIDNATESIQVLMNLNSAEHPKCHPTCYPYNDPVGAADYCDRVAAQLLGIRADLARVHVNARDKSLLRAGLAGLAASWQARGRAWRKNGRGDVKAHLDSIARPYRTALEAFARVQEYLR